MAHIEITTRIGCELNCKFCPQDLLNANYKSRIRTMNLDVFKMCIDKVPTLVDVHFSGMCEPFLHDNCIDMIDYVYRKGHKISIFTTLVGLDISKYKKLLEYDFDLFCLHIPDNDNLSNFNLSNDYLNLFNFVVKNKPNATRFWYQCHGTPHYRIIGLTGNNVDKFIVDRAGNVESDFLRKTNIKGKFTCCCNVGYVLLPNGDVVLCCMDYALRHKLGNLLINNYEDLHKSDEIRKINDAMNGNGEVLCNSCNRATQI